MPSCRAWTPSRARGRRSCCWRWPACWALAGPAFGVCASHRSGRSGMRRVGEQMVVREGLQEGLHLVKRHAPMRAILLLVATVGFLGMPYAVLLPQFAGEVLGGGSQSYGWLLTASGSGALGGA